MTGQRKCCGSCQQQEYVDTSGRGLCIFEGIVLSEDVCAKWIAREQPISKAIA